MLVYRIISDIILVFIIIPIYLSIIILGLVYNLVNSFHWSNFYRSMDIVKQQQSLPLIITVLITILSIITESIEKFIKAIKQLEDCEF